MNEWLQQGDAGIMAVERASVASAGYRYNLSPSLDTSFKSLVFRISGNAAAQYYVNIFNRDGIDVVESGWIDSPRE